MKSLKSHDDTLSAADRYTCALRNGRKSRLPPGVSDPQPPVVWPPENVALLERYRAWLVGDGAGHTCIDLYYLPVAGHILGFNLKPHPQLDLDNDLEKVMAYAQAKQLSARVIAMYRSGLNRFRRFLLLERGVVETTVNFKPPNIARYQEGLPTWLVEQLTHYQQIRQAGWRPARLNQALLKFWSTHTRLFRWLFAHYPITVLHDIRRDHIFAYLDERLAAGAAVKSVNQELRAFHAALRFLQERDFAVPQALLRLQGLKEPDALPRFLTDEHVNALRTDLEQRVNQAPTPVAKRNALLDRAAFYLLWQGGLRLGEVEELTLADLNLTQRHLVVRRGKGLQDRAVYLTDGAVAALTAYLVVRGSSQTDHVFLFRHKPVCKDFIRGRIKAAGERTGVKVTPHQLRHTFATQLLNAGCKITTIQALLGHRHPNSTLVYARLHDHTVAADYLAAITIIEGRLAQPGQQSSAHHSGINGQNPPANEDAARLLTLAAALETESLTANQQAILNELQQGLAELLNEIPKQVVNEPAKLLSEPMPWP
ncbi:MAG: tyrosine-type recombinase/integrase [Chloroflexi bacterium]|nr:tyrosine-type recombinase/integrase [Chloroflexota bacterium]